MNIKSLLTSFALLLLTLPAQAQNRSADEINRQLIEGRALEAAIWGMSAVNTDLMRQEMLTKTPGKVNQFIYWGRPLEDVNFDSTIRYDSSFYQSLNRVVQSEPWIERDRAMIDQLRSIGIEKGKPFNPDARIQPILTAAIGDAKVLLEQRYDAGFPVFYPGTHWTMPALSEAVEGQSSTYANPDKYATDARGVAYTYAYIAIKRLGAGQFYLITIRDKDGEAYDGGKSYRLRVPPDVPVAQYWSVTAYDRDTHALIKNMPRASRASNAADLQKNADGSVDIYFGPVAPAGKDTNWVPTDPARKFELMARFYAPKKEFFEKKWALPDVEKVGATIGSGAKQ